MRSQEAMASECNQSASRQNEAIAVRGFNSCMRAGCETSLKALHDARSSDREGCQEFCWQILLCYAFFHGLMLTYRSSIFKFRASLSPFHFLIFSRGWQLIKNHPTIFCCRNARSDLTSTTRTPRRPLSFHNKIFQ